MGDSGVKDLLGTNTADPPPMDAPLPLRVFRLNDCDWWMARTLEEAKVSYIADCGPMTDEEAFDESRELTDEELDRLKFHDTDGYDRPIKRSIRTFREELRQQIEMDPITPRMFACTEY
jgi:hypothetical protein